MTGRLKTADQLKEAVILRDGGYSLAAIAVKTGISASTLSRHFKKIGAAKGGLTEDVMVNKNRTPVQAAFL
ncbi:winged helix-turn-helix transcriptional regulator [Methylomonas montana]|uniref:winged helix-turn-helix transcriptional regulator n=1 Tax=Methylomonas montana TaxID=3058963 RepID=UPI002657DA15|nr:winged helix-turn-helix transcriptional regulator [Methylomonas montana]WKJ89074.1 winged helix-turn-helix transcriptional regulator [Methylomonas montana]